MRSNSVAVDRSRIPEDPERSDPEPVPPRVALSANSLWNIINFRMPLIESLQREQYQVHVLAPAGSARDSLESRGVRVHEIGMAAEGTSPIADARLLIDYLRLLHEVRPAAYLGFTAKPNIYGSLAAALLGIPVVNNITGLGTAFIHRMPLQRIVSVLYRLALRRSAAVFFHNPDDLQLFVGRGLVNADRAALIPGSGVDLNHFSPAPPSERSEALSFLFIGRLLWEKGVGEFVDAARRVKQVRPDTRFVVLGSPARGPRGVPAAQVEQWEREGLVEYIGSQDDIRPFVAASDCVVLPSYREGLPRVLLEASAMARPSIAADVPGCRHAVEAESTGYLCAPRSGEALAKAMLRFARLPFEQRAEMGQRARQLATERFAQERVTDAYLSVMRRVAPSPGAVRQLNQPVGSRVE